MKSRQREPLTIAIMLESDMTGGAEIMTLDLALALRERGHTVHYVGPDDGTGWLGARYRSHGFGAHTYSLPRPLHYGCLDGLRRLARQLRVDVIHSHEFAMAVYGAAVGTLDRVPHVITLHGNPRTLGAWRRRVALRWAFKRSQVVVPVSNATRRTIEGAMGKGFPNVTVVPNGVPQRSGDPAPIRAELGLAPDETLIVAAGTCTHRKGHIVLLQALERLGGDWRWRVAIAGRPDDATPALEQFIREHGWERRAHLLGGRSDVPNLLAAADIFAMPSLIEGLPLALLEAMLAGKPVVASTCYGIPEAVTHEEHGLLSAPGDVEGLAQCLARLRDDTTGLAAQLGAAARRRAEAEFTLETMAERYEALYYRAVQARGGGGNGVEARCRRPEAG